MSRSSEFSYRASGVNRNSRAKLRQMITQNLPSREDYPYGKPLELPFGRLYRSGKNSPYYLDFEIEGVGTKTLLAELDPDGYSTIGIDGVAMVANDIARSGARTILLNDAIHIANSDRKIVRKIIAGVQAGTQLCGATLASGETGDVSEILHPSLKAETNSLPFDLIVSGLGTAWEQDVIRGNIRAGDDILGIESSGVHSNGVTLARKILLKNWRGRFDPFDTPEGFRRPLIKELLTPTRIYAKALEAVNRRFNLKAAIHVTGDGLAKFSRLAEFQADVTSERGRGTVRRKGIGFDLDNIGEMPDIFRLIFDSARELGKKVSIQEMFRTFNMGIGFAVVVAKEDSDGVLDQLDRYFPSKKIGRVTDSGWIIVSRYEGASRAFSI